MVEIFAYIVLGIIVTLIGIILVSAAGMVLMFIGAVIIAPVAAAARALKKDENI